MERRDPNEDELPESIRRRIHGEILENLPDSPERPGRLALRLRVAMQSAVLEAHEQGSPIDKEDAQIIAEVLSFALDRADTALGSYGRRNGTDYEAVREELIELAARPTLRLEIREVINWLTTYLLYEQVPQLEPDPRDDDGGWTSSIGYKSELGLTAAFHIKGTPEAAELDTDLTRFILEHGVPALAYLRLPDVDASAPDLDEQFRRRYLGGYTDVGGMIHVFRRET